MERTVAFESLPKVELQLLFTDGGELIADLELLMLSSDGIYVILRESVQNGHTTTSLFISKSEKQSVHIEALQHFVLFSETYSKKHMGHSSAISSG